MVDFEKFTRDFPLNFSCLTRRRACEWRAAALAAFREADRDEQLRRAGKPGTLRAFTYEAWLKEMPRK